MRNVYHCFFKSNRFGIFAFIPSQSGVIITVLWSLAFSFFFSMENGDQLGHLLIYYLAFEL